MTRLILCSGKVYVDLVSPRGLCRSPTHVAVARIEELYPFPEEEFGQVFSGYPNLREVVWLQEEPRNMGAWVFVSSRIREQLPPDVEFSYVGRAESSQPVRKGPHAATRSSRTAF